MLDPWPLWVNPTTSDMEPAAPLVALPVLRNRMLEFPDTLPPVAIVKLPDSPADSTNADAITTLPEPLDKLEPDTMETLPPTAADEVLPAARKMSPAVPFTA